MQIGLGISAVRTHLGFTDVQTSADRYGKSPSEMEATLEAMVGGYDVLDQHECLTNGR